MRKLIGPICILTLILSATVPAEAQNLNAPSFTIGWVSNAGFSDIGFETTGEPLHRDRGVAKIDFNYHFSALFLGGAFPISFGDAGSLLLRGSATIPSILEGYSLISRLTPAPPEAIGARWEADTFWSTLDAIYAYPVNQGLFALAGFRWCHWSTTFKNPVELFDPFLGWRQSDVDTADFEVEGYFPVLGIMSSMGGFTFGALGFPYFPGTVNYRETFAERRTGRILEGAGAFGGDYFLELWLEYVVPTDQWAGGMVDGTFTLYGKYNATRAVSQFDVSLSRSTHLVDTQLFDFSFQRQLFVIGGKLSVDFDLSDLTNGWINL